MAINFPSTPTLNQVYTSGDRTWTWNGRYWKATSTTIGYTGSAGAVVASISATPPSTPSLGDVWIDSATGIQYFYVDDGDSAQWVEFSNPGTGAVGGAGGGATGGGGDQVFYENDQTITTSYTIPVGKNALTTGPVTISSGTSVTVPDGSRWVIL
jgi:hypothetical protein